MDGKKREVTPMTTVHRVDKPWGYELIWAVTPQYVGKVLVIRGGESLSYQYHEKKEESIFVADGAMDLEYEVDGQRRVQRLHQGTSFHIPAGMRHRMSAVEDCRIFEVSTPHLDDVVRVEDNYGRA